VYLTRDLFTIFVSTHGCNFSLEFQFDISVKLVTVVMLFTQGY